VTHFNAIVHQHFLESDANFSPDAHQALASMTAHVVTLTLVVVTYVTALFHTWDQTVKKATCAFVTTLVKMVARVKLMEIT